MSQTALDLEQPIDIDVKRRRGRPRKGEERSSSRAKPNRKSYQEKYKRYKLLGEYFQQLIDRGDISDPGELIRLQRVKKFSSTELMPLNQLEPSDRERIYVKNGFQRLDEHPPQP